MSVLGERAQRNREQSNKLWASLVDEYGADRALGGTDDAQRCAERAAEEWEAVKKLAGRPLNCVLEYGAGTGRVAKVAAPDCRKLLLYEPCDAIRQRLRTEVAGWDEALSSRTQVLAHGDFACLGSGVVGVIFSVTVVNHLSYSELWSHITESRALAGPGTRVVVHYRQNWGKGHTDLIDAMLGDWPIYAWHHEQLALMFGAAGFECVGRIDKPWAFDCYKLREA